MRIGRAAVAAGVLALVLVAWAQLGDDRNATQILPPGDLVALAGGTTAPKAIATAEVAVFTVNNPGGGSDWQLDDGRCDADLDAVGDQCTLLAAVENSRLQSGHSRINFSIGSGPVTIETGAVSLPMQGRGRTEAGDSLIVDGTTQPGYEGKPLIRIREPATQIGAFPMFVLGPGSSLRGVITDEVSTTPNGGVVIEDTWIGLDSTGDAASDYARSHPYGVYLGGPDNMLGGTTAAAQNVIAGQQRGVQVAGAGRVMGNLIGTDADGTGLVGFPAVTSTQGYGVVVASGAGVVIADNVVSGAAQSGIRIERLASGTRVQGNFIGTDINGQSALPNVNGVEIRGATDTIIGGPGAARNLISGNTDGWGITINGVFVGGTFLADRTTVENNRIGTDLGGSYAIPNAIGVGVRSGSALVADNLISGSTIIGVQLDRCEPSCGVPQSTGERVVRANRIGTNADGTAGLGGSTFGAVRIAARERLNSVTDNLISGNEGHGVIVDLDATQNVIARNVIGLNAAEAAPLPNAAAVAPSLVGQGFTPAGVLLRGALETRVESNVISGNAADGIHISGQSKQARANVVRSNAIGLNAAGTNAVPNEGDGVQIAGDAINNVIGGPSAAPQSGACTGPCNFVSGNTGSGIKISGAAATANRVEGNFVGLGVDGDNGLANTVGISIQDGSANSIGGAAPGVGNVVSGNEQDGISITGAGAENVVQANTVGLSAGGLEEVGNGRDGIVVETPRNRIGGTTEESGNVVSGNGRHGILLLGEQAVENLILGNLVGTDPGGTEDRGNVGDGIALEGAPRNAIGGAAEDAGNTVSGNEGNGIRIAGEKATQNTVQGNLVGTTPSALIGLGNALDGILIDGAPHNTLGANVVSGNRRNGIRIDGPGLGPGEDVVKLRLETRIEDNLVGTNGDGTAAIANQQSGIHIDGTNANLIGTPGAGNVVSGNRGEGVRITGTSVLGRENKLQGNLIGTDADGAAKVPNEGDGVKIEFTPSNLIGGRTPDERNVISGNAGNGVYINAERTQVEGNVIGTNAAADAALGNTKNGIFVAAGSLHGLSGGEGDADWNLIGAAAEGAGNVISGNVLSGIHLRGERAAAKIEGNRIGTNKAGTAAVRNSRHGVEAVGAFYAWIGAAAEGAGNVISGNGRDGILLTSGAAADLRGNMIGTDPGGAAAVPNEASGIEILHGEDATRSTTSASIGGPDDGQGNVISGNRKEGVWISGADAFGYLWGNLIGVAAGGTGVLGNEGSGVLIESASKSVVGGNRATTPTAACAGDCNVVASNGAAGIAIKGGSKEVVVEGNFVGTDISGMEPRGNFVGIEIDGAAENVVKTNLVSRNGGAGILLRGAGATTNRIEGNTVGTISDGTEPLGNIGAGIELDGAPANKLTGNTVSGNGAQGVLISGLAARGNELLDNEVGTYAGGAGAIPNEGDGVRIVNAPQTIVGQPGKGNTISGNGQNGLAISGAAAERTLVQGNVIGPFSELQASDEYESNKQAGIRVDDAASTTIGGLEAGARNVISGNGASGITLRTANDALVLGNLIGTDPDGTQALRNRAEGIRLTGGARSVVGGDTAQARNVISANGAEGVEIGSSAVDTVVQGNFIGTDVTGTVPLGNLSSGVQVLTGVRDTLIGGSGASAGNLISANGEAATGSGGTTGYFGEAVTGAGIYLGGASIDGPGSRATLIRNNLIGTNVSREPTLGNFKQGIMIEGSSDNLIGGFGATLGNTIAGNDEKGVVVRPAVVRRPFGDPPEERIPAERNSILGNSIFANEGLGIDLNDDGATPNDPGDADAGPNGLQNSPLLSSAKVEGNSLSLGGTVLGRPGALYRVEVFASMSCDPSGFGEGEKLVGSFAAATDETFSQELATPALPVITATSTDAAGNTSEFSRCAVVDGGSIVGSNPTPVPGGTVTISGDGLAPGSQASVSLFSEPVLLGMVTANDVGGFSGSFTIPADTELGPHRIEVTGSAPDSSARTLVFDIWVISINSPPLADAGADGSAKEGDVVTLDGSGSSDPDGDALQYSWTQLEGTAVTLSSGSAAKPTFSVPEEGTYRFALEVSDGSLASTQDEVVVTATNAAPIATFIAPTTVLEGSTVPLTLASPVDVPADLAELQFAFDCGVGYGPLGVAAAATCAASDNGARSVGGKVRDGDGGESEYRAAVTVQNVVPSVTAALAQTATAGQEKAFELGSFADPGPDAPWTVRIDWGDGAAPTIAAAPSAPGPLGTASHSYPAVGTFTATVSVIDKDGGIGSAGFPVTVGPGREPTQQQCVVPRLKGKTLAQAKAALVRGRCKLGRVRKAKSKKIKKGRVVSQTPAAGRSLPLGSKVNVVLSDGPPKKTKKKQKRRQ